MFFKHFYFSFLLISSSCLSKIEYDAIKHQTPQNIIKNILYFLKYTIACSVGPYSQTLIPCVASLTTICSQARRSGCDATLFNIPHL